MAKSTRKTNNNKTRSHSSQYIYIVIGMVLTFISIIALFNWGFFGSLVLNTFRLFVGEAYDLLLVAISTIGLAMIIKRDIVNIPIRKLLGVLLILSAITTLLHFNHFFPLEPLSDNVFQLTFEIFRNEFLTGQNQLSIGGGMLGAAFYASFGYLFGRWGTYLLCGILFFIGLMLLVGASIDAVGKAIKVFFMSIYNGVKGIFNSLQEARDAYRESFSDDDEVSEEESSVEPESQVEPDYLDTEPHTTSYNVNSDTSLSTEIKLPLLGRLKRFFTNDKEVSDAYDPWQTDYEPSKKIDNQPEWDNYSSKDALATRAAMERERLRRDKDLVLDLDYFDEMSETTQTNPISNSEPTTKDQTIASYNQASFKEEQHVSPGDLPETIEAPAEEALSERQAIEAVNSTNSATHWQTQSQTVQDTTFDELDEILMASNHAEVATSKSKKKVKHKGYQLPSKNLLTKIPPVDQSEEYELINENIDKLERTFQSFGVDAKVVKANLGPAVTKYEIEPAIGVKVSKIVSLSDDIALALAARDVRIEAPIPGKSLIGIEVPNRQVSPVSFWEIIEAALESDNLLEVPLGRDISGSVCLADLSKMPHLLIAGATGSGKSVGMNVIIVSLLMKAKPNQVKFLMIDPKKVELTMYNELPHLLSPVVTNPRKAAQALNNVVQEMEHRYELFAAAGVRNVDSYNEHVEEMNATEGTGYDQLPKIVVFIDELADLMLVAGNEVENAIIRLAQMARAAGIHMIIATQRPSVDVITGIIKANIPSRLAFAVSSGTDSRTILDSVGAEKLLGRGDMLFQPMGKNKPLRVQGAYISDREVERITDFIREQSEPEYDEAIVVSDESIEMAQASDDEYFEEAVEMIRSQETVSISQLQRKFRIGYNRAARLIDDMEALGFVSEPDGSKPRQVLIEEID